MRLALLCGWAALSFCLLVPLMVADYAKHEERMALRVDAEARYGRLPDSDFAPLDRLDGEMRLLRYIVVPPSVVAEAMGYHITLYRALTLPRSGAALCERGCPQWPSQYFTEFAIIAVPFWSIVFLAGSKLLGLANRHRRKLMAVKRSQHSDAASPPRDLRP